LVRAQGEEKVYLIENNQKRWIPSIEVFNAKGYSWNSVQVVNLNQISAISEGTNVQTGSAAVPSLSSQVPQALKNAELLRVNGQEKVYAKIDNILRWVPSIEAFNLYNYDWSKVKIVSSVNQYRESRLIRAQGDSKVYYITSNGQKKWIVNEAVFNSYSNRWDDIVEVSAEELNLYPSVNLLRAQGEEKVYLIENLTKRWIKTANIFVSKGYKWENIDVVNKTEIAAYGEESAVE